MGGTNGKHGAAGSPDASTLMRALRESYAGPAWHGPSVLGALRGVSAADAAEPPAPERNTIWDLVLHLAYVRHRSLLRVARLRGLDAPPFPRKLKASWFPEVPAVRDEAAWTDDKALLAAYQERLLDVLEGLPVATLRTCRRGTTRSIGDELLGVALHDAYHAGQIRLLGKLREGR